MELASKLWDKLDPAHDFIISIALALVTAFLLWLLRARVKLIWGSTSSNYHQFKLREDGEKISIWTEKFFVQNTGKKAASNVEIVFSEHLTSFNLWPPRDHTPKLLENGHFVIHVPSIAPGELVIVDMIDIDARGPRLLSVNCPDALSKTVRFMATRQFSWPINLLIGYLMIAGLVGTIYLVLQLTIGRI
ncbi:hypothetical protein QKW60_18525 [Defluviimonas aestuarii]|uniref:hypothetical protein n=1 Tax=Albidovulum aestuarii TaxID=1130726 RepID=UPI002499D682|nr:hypothetical protein [Defluviimonas aestuarii]MDI3338411.1 hypothetical protein [Defluviimonas aestuarii]